MLGHIYSCWYICGGKACVHSRAHAKSHMCMLGHTHGAVAGNSATDPTGQT